MWNSKAAAGAYPRRPANHQLQLWGAEHRASKKRVQTLVDFLSVLFDFDVGSGTADSKSFGHDFYKRSGTDGACRMGASNLYGRGSADGSSDCMSADIYRIWKCKGIHISGYFPKDHRIDSDDLYPAAVYG